jgi:hypothetical protein
MLAAAAALVAGVLAVGVHAAARDGGFSIATAPEVVLGEAEFGAPVNGARYWRIPLRPRDALTLELRNGALWDLDRPIRYCLLAPNVNDANLARSACAAQRTVRRGESYRLRFSAAAGGDWTLGAVSSTCSTFQRCATDGDTFSFVYEFTAHVQRFTRITLRGPSVVRPGAQISFAGTVSGVEGGAVEVRAAGGKRQVVRLARNGTFAWSARAPSQPGRYRVRALYRGDAAHLASSAVVSYRVG